MAASRALFIGRFQPFHNGHLAMARRILQDHGELIIAKLKPEGYQEISRTKLIKPTSNPGNRRQLSVVNWSQPAYADKHIFARNDEEILSASLAK